MPEVKSIAISSKKGTKKLPVESCLLIEDFGFENDAHAAKGSMRQVSILPFDKFEAFKNIKNDIGYGDFGENLVVSFDRTPNIGECLQIGGAVVEVTCIGKECHNGCSIKNEVGYCIMPEFGLFAKVIKGGEVRVADSCSYCK